MSTAIKCFETYQWFGLEMVSDHSAFSATSCMPINNPFNSLNHRYRSILNKLLTFGAQYVQPNVFLCLIPFLLFLSIKLWWWDCKIMAESNSWVLYILIFCYFALKRPFRKAGFLAKNTICKSVFVAFIA